MKNVQCVLTLMEEVHSSVFSFAFVNVLELHSKRCTAFIPTTALHTAHLLRPLSYSYA